MTKNPPANAHEVTVFGQSDFDATGNLVYPKLVKRTLRPPKFYPPFSSLCSRRRMEPYPWNMAPQSTSVRWLLRERRAIDLADATGLSLRHKKLKQSEELEARVRKVVKADHASFWINPAGALFMLSELYDSWKEDHSIFERAGLMQARVPLGLAPWGGIDRRNGQEPEGRSYLYCDTSNAAEMAEIVSKLEAAALTAPRWDDAKGVSYV